MTKGPADWWRRAGFLTVGDLPPAGPKVELWVATQVELPKDEFQDRSAKA